VIFRPISKALLHCVEKCVPSTAISVVIAVRSDVFTTAASSPIPISTPRCEVPKMRASAAITPASSKFIPLSLIDYLDGAHLR